MQVKVFEAQDMRSALEKVKGELGPEALILSTRSIQKKKFGFSGKPWIEVTAAVDGSKGQEELTPAPEQGRDTGSKADSDKVREARDRTYTRKGTFEEVLDNSGPKPLTPDRSSQDGGLYQELREMRQSFQGLVREFSEAKGRWARDRTPPGDAPAGQDFGLGESGQRIWSELSALGLGTEFLQLFFELQKDNLKGAAQEGENSLDRHLEQSIAGMIKIQNPASGLLDGQKRLSFIGPTGVGKTTTLAKVAANYLMAGGKRLVLASIDNYRIAAIEQLKIYGQIMNVPVEVARSPEQLQEIFARHQDKDLILVDTAGRNPRDEMGQQELAEFLDPTLQTENHLVLSATTRESDLFSVIDRFAHLKLQGLAFTKLDECDFLGQILNVQIKAGYPLSFLTNGQKVPEDILPPEPGQLAAMILNRNEVDEKWNIEETGIRPEPSVH